MYLGVDLGGSSIKFIACTSNMQVIEAFQVSSDLPPKNIIMKVNSLIQKYSIDKLVLTGVGASFLAETDFEIKAAKTLEFEAIGLGGLYTSNCKDALVISMGTGTALVRANYNKRTHIGGIGVGGGTISGLGQLLIKEKELVKISELANDGNLQKVDLLVGDICCDKIETLPLFLTAANFGKIEENISKSDIALGLLNMVYQIIVKTAMFACIGAKTRNVILTGALAEIKQAKDIIEPFAKLYDLNFIIPKNAAFSTAIGAIVSQYGEEI